MSKFSNRKNPIPNDFHRSIRSKKSKRQFDSETKKHSDSPINSQYWSAHLKPVSSESLACGADKPASEASDKEEKSAISKEKNTITIGAGVSDALSISLSEKSQNIHLTAQYAEVESSLEDGLRYYQQEEFSKCILTLEKAVSAKRENAKLNFWLGMSYYQIQQIDKSLEYFILASPTNNGEYGYVESYFWLGEIYRQQNKLIQSSENYQKLLLLAPNSTFSSLALEHLTSIKFETLF